MGNTSKRYSAEVQERAVRLFQEHVHEYPTRWAAMQSIAGKIGCTAETMRSWVVKAEAAADPRRNASLADRERVKQLECGATISVRARDNQVERRWSRRSDDGADD